MSLFNRHKLTLNTNCESPHDQGRSAQVAGQPDTVCPYPCGTPMSDKRTQWMSGFYGERVRRVLEKVDAA